jgi:hypothetical protein
VATTYDFIALRLIASCHLCLDSPQPVPAQTPLPA